MNNKYDEKDYVVREILRKARRYGWQAGYRICPDHGAYRWANNRAYCCEHWFRSVVLSRDFARAYFGDKVAPRYKKVGDATYIQLPEFLSQMQTMVIETDLVTYLKKYL